MNLIPRICRRSCQLYMLPDRYFFTVTEYSRWGNGRATKVTVRRSHIAHLPNHSQKEQDSIRQSAEHRGGEQQLPKSPCKRRAHLSQGNGLRATAKRFQASPARRSVNTLPIMPKCLLNSLPVLVLESDIRLDDIIEMQRNKLLHVVTERVSAQPREQHWAEKYSGETFFESVTSICL
jgi:hypothetical protein